MKSIRIEKPAKRHILGRKLKKILETIINNDYIII